MKNLLTIATAAALVAVMAASSTSFAQTRPAYCGGAGTERLPECGWSEGQGGTKRTMQTDPIGSRCKLKEDEIRSLYNTAIIPSHGSEAERIRITEQLVQAAENVCRDSYTRQTPPLPEELRKLSR